MSPTEIHVDELPDDVAILKAMIRVLLEQLGEQQSHLSALHDQLAVLKKRLFGPRSERMSIDQLRLFLDEDEEGEGKSVPAGAGDEESEDGDDGPEEPVAPRRRKRKGGGRKPFPADLPRDEVRFRPPEADEPCEACGGRRTKIDEEVSEQLEYVPASYRVKVFIREKWACPCGKCGVAIGEVPVKPVEKGAFGPGLMAHVLTSKFADHLPLYRQAGIVRRHGIDMSRSTLVDLVRQGAELLQPIVDVMKEEVLASPIVYSDDTGVPVLKPGHGKTVKGYLWVYVGSDDHGIFNHALFVFTPTRHGGGPQGPQEVLGDYQGIVVADAFSGYDAVFETEAVTEGGCLMHARRYWVRAQGSAPRESAQALVLIQEVYRIEREATEMGLNAAQRLVLRQERTAPVMGKLKELVDRQKREALPESPLGKAATYATNQWDALTLFLKDGRIHPDNRVSENSLRPGALGRKNWLFAGSNKGGRRGAVMYSLVVSCRLHGIDPWAYLSDVLMQVHTHPASRVAELTPKAWAERRRREAEAAATEDQEADAPT